MILKIKLGLSNRHIHLTEATYNKLFNHSLTVKKYLTQPGEFAANECLTIKGPQGQIENVRVVGPHRSYDQIEISQRDARVLGINPPVRKSGDLQDSASLYVKGPQGKLLLKNACIIANRHVHFGSDMALKYGLKDNQKVKILILNEKSAVLDAYVKISPRGLAEIHLDTDDGNAFRLTDDTILDVLI